MTEGLFVAVGLTVLVIGGELIVRGASRLALSLGLSPLVVGLTVVAFGTSSPELAVSLEATLGGSPDVAVGNVVGSNIYNILLILGLAALLRPLIVRSQLVRFDVPLVIGTSLLLWLVVLDGSLSAMEGALLLALLAAYVLFSIRIGRRSAAAATGREPVPEHVSEPEPEPRAELPSTGRSRMRDGLVFLAGLVAIVVGAQLLVNGATGIARSLGVSDLVVGLTVVAVGTSLPELVTSTVAALRGHRDLAVGNVMGSNLFNILGILGLSAAVAPGGIPVAAQVRTFDIPVMTVVAVACLPLLFTGYQLRRWEGALFVAYAAAYTAYVVLEATQHPFRDPFADAIVWFAVPLTAITLVTVVARDVASRRARLDRSPVPPG